MDAKSSGFALPIDGLCRKTLDIEVNFFTNGFNDYRSLTA